MKQANRKTLWITLAAIYIVFISGYVAHLTWEGIKEKKFKILEYALIHSIDKVGHITHFTYGWDMEFKPVDDPKNWVIHMLDFKSAEVYPFNLEGERLFESKVYAGGNFKYDNKVYPENTRIITENAYGTLVLRATGRITMSGNIYGVNADVSLKEVALSYAHRLYLLTSVVVVALISLYSSLTMRRSINSDNLDKNSVAVEELGILHAVLDELDMSLIVADVDQGRSRVIMVTQKFLSLINMFRSEVIGQELEMFLDPERREWHRDQVNHLHKTGDEIDRRDVHGFNPSTKEPINVSLLPRRTKPFRGKRYPFASILPSQGDVHGTRRDEARPATSEVGNGGTKTTP